MPFESFAVRARGSFHILWNMVCQDSVKCYGDEKCTIVAVADGHGAAPYFRSHKGSKYAANCAVKCLKRVFRRAYALKQKDECGYKSFLQSLNDREESQRLAREVFETIHREWLKCVYKDIDKHPFCWHEYTGLTQELIDVYEGSNRALHKAAYGTTLVAAAFCDDFCIALQLGDGDCVSLYGDGSLSRDIPPDEEDFGPDMTYSMCSFDAAEKFRYFVSTENMPSAVFVTTDGIVNSLNDKGELDDFFKGLAEELATGDLKSHIKKLRKRLYRISSHGCGDDVSLGGIISTQG